MGNANSGRHPIYEEYHKASAINKLWKKLHAKIEANEELTEFEEKLVAPLLSKTIKTQTDITSGNKPLPILGGLTITQDAIQTDDSSKEDSSVNQEA